MRARIIKVNKPANGAVDGGRKRARNYRTRANACKNEAERRNKTNKEDGGIDRICVADRLEAEEKAMKKIQKIQNKKI